MEQLISILSSLPPGAIYGAAFGILLACGLGLPIPEDITLFTLGFFSYKGQVDLVVSIVVAMVGVLLGDTITYLIGRYLGDSIMSMPGLRSMFTPNRMHKVKASFDKFGNIFIFFARFAVGLRAPTFWAAGHFKVSFVAFLLLDGFAALISVPLFVYLGYKTGGLIEDIKKYETIVGVSAAVIIVGLVALSIYKHRKSDAAPDDIEPGELLSTPLEPDDLQTGSLAASEKASEPSSPTSS